MPTVPIKTAIGRDNDIKGGNMETTRSLRNIALTVWGNRISPVFDSAETLLIVRVENLKIAGRFTKKFNPKIGSMITSVLKQHQVDELICGAIVQAQLEIIEKSGVKLIPFISGNADSVLASYIQTPCHIFDYLMPGAMLENMNPFPEARHD
jgi:predicted Fe-Mo cluster-binding NifX family protein